MVISCACSTPARVYSSRYDATYCPTCNKWLESVCGDKTCAYCWGRPATPIVVDDGLSKSMQDYIAQVGMEERFDEVVDTDPAANSYLDMDAEK